MNLTDLLSGSVISSIAGQTGTSEKDTQNVLANALPALVGAMAQNASTEDGANSLAKALDDHTSSKGWQAFCRMWIRRMAPRSLPRFWAGKLRRCRTLLPKRAAPARWIPPKSWPWRPRCCWQPWAAQKKKTKTQSDGLGGLLTSLLGGGDDDEDDGSTLISLAGSLLGGSNKKSGKSRQRRHSYQPCGRPADQRPGRQRQKSDSSDVLSSLAAACWAARWGLPPGRKPPPAGKRQLLPQKRPLAVRKLPPAKKTTSSKKKSTAQNDDAAEQLGSVLTGLLGGKK